MKNISPEALNLDLNMRWVEIPASALKVVYIYTYTYNVHVAVRVQKLGFEVEDFLRRSHSQKRPVPSCRPSCTDLALYGGLA